MADVTGRELRDAYGRAAVAWAEGPQRAYRRLSEALLTTAVSPLAGRLVLDLGAGTGATSRACLDAGARVVAVDAAAGMLAHQRRSRPPAVAADAYRLPLRSGSFDAVVAAFVFNHLSDPVAALAEAARTTRHGGQLLAATFHAEWDHPAKEQVEAAAKASGWRRPGWYEILKTRNAVALGHPDAFAAAAARAGWTDVRMTDTVVDTGLSTAAEFAAWRLGMAQFAVFLDGLSPGARHRLAADAERRIGRSPGRLRPRVVFCTGRRRPPSGRPSP